MKPRTRFEPKHSNIPAIRPLVLSESGQGCGKCEKCLSGDVGLCGNPGETARDTDETARAFGATDVIDSSKADAFDRKDVRGVFMGSGVPKRDIRVPAELPSTESSSNPHC